MCIQLSFFFACSQLGADFAGEEREKKVNSSVSMVDVVRALQKKVRKRERERENFRTLWIKVGRRANTQ